MDSPKICPNMQPFNAKTGYIKKSDSRANGDTWMLVGHDGVPVMADSNKSSCFFFAADNEIKVVLLN